MLTIFTHTKAFKGHIGSIQRNALAQWTRLRPRPEIFLFGNREGAAEIAREFGFRHIPDVKYNEYGTPLLSDLFEKAQGMASNSTMCFANADMMLLGDFMGAVRRVTAWRDRFLMVGRRTNLDLDEPAIYDSPEQEGRLLALVSRQGRMGPPVAIDYFVFSKGLVPNFPPFAIGRVRWDNWFLWKAKDLKVPLIDATEVVLAVHQNHDYSHHPQGWQGVLDGEEAMRNRALARLGYCTIEDASYKLTEREIEPHSRPLLSSVGQRIKTSWWELMRMTRPIRLPLGLHREGIASIVTRRRLRSS